MTTAEALAAFEQGWQHYHGLSHEHSTRQRADLARLAGGGELLDLDGAALRAYLESQVAAGKQASTVGQILVRVRPFFTWAFEHRLITAERYLEIKSVRPPRNGKRHEPRPYTARDRERFWQDFERKYPWTFEMKRTPERLRQNTRERGAKFFERWCEGRSRWSRCRPYCLRLQAEAIVQLAMIGGLRRIEVYNLQLDDLDPDNEYVIVQGARKGDGREKERAVPWLTQGMRDAVDAWLQVRARIMAVAPPPPGREHDRPWLYLYINGGGRPAYRMRFGPFEQTMREIGPWEWHRMRHTAITEMIRAGYPIQDASKIAGHTDIRMTQRYMGLVRDDLVHTARINQARYERQMERSSA